MLRRRKKEQEGVKEGDRKAFAKFLAEDEELVLATGYGQNFLRHKWCYFLLFPGGIGFVIPLIYAYQTNSNIGYALLIGLIFACILAYLKTTLFYHANRFLFTTRRVIIKKGFFSVNMVTALYDKITHIEVVQTLFDRMIMKHGTIIIHTAGSNKDELKLEYIDKPIEVKNLLERLINREREQFGRPTTPVVEVEGELVDE